MNAWFILISLHTIVATVCFIAGIFIISPERAKKYKWLVSIFVWTLFLMIIFMIGATLSHWRNITISQRITFSALAGLGIYMFYRGYQAKKRFSKNHFSTGYIDDVGFVLIALFDGFAIVSLLDMKMPVWIIVSGAILAIFIGSRFVNTIKRKFFSNKEKIN